MAKMAYLNLDHRRKGNLRKFKGILGYHFLFFLVGSISKILLGTKKQFEFDDLLHEIKRAFFIHDKALFYINYGYISTLSMIIFLLFLFLYWIVHWAFSKEVKRPQI